MMHSYLLSGADQPDCTTCRCPLTVKHILVECSDFNDTRTKYFVASSMEELFRTVDVRNVLVASIVKISSFNNDEMQGPIESPGPVMKTRPNS